VFPVSQIVISAVVGAVASVVLLLARNRWSKDPPLPTLESILVALAVGASILFWRLVGNVDVLNQDAVPLVSPNDVLCAVLTYVFLGLYNGLRRTEVPSGWNWICATLTLVSFVVNVVTI
jgi:hypothetical protein